MRPDKEILSSTDRMSHGFSGDFGRANVEYSALPLHVSLSRRVFAVRAAPVFLSDEHSD